MVFDLVEIATYVLTVFVIARVALAVPPFRRLVARVLNGRDDNPEAS